jgi:hypothetical protein
MSHTAQRFLTCLHAALASLGADPATFVFAAVTLALIAAKTARDGTDVEHAADHLLIRPKRPVPAQTSAQSRLKRMHCARSRTLSSARDASAHDVHVCGHEPCRSMRRSRPPRERAGSGFPPASCSSLRGSSPGHRDDRIRHPASRDPFPWATARQAMLVPAGLAKGTCHSGDLPTRNCSQRLQNRVGQAKCSESGRASSDSCSKRKHFFFDQAFL